MTRKQLRKINLLIKTLILSSFFFVNDNFVIPSSCIKDGWHAFASSSKKFKLVSVLYFPDVSSYLSRYVFRTYVFRNRILFSECPAFK